MNQNEIWKNSLFEARAILEKFIENPELMRNCGQFSDLLIDTYKSQGNVFICGNGGSHCDSMHFAEELTGQFRKARKPLGALALGDPSHVTCVSNDFGFEHIFSRQLRGLARKADCLIALSTSGNSKNVIEAVKAAKEIGMKTVGLLGKSGGELSSLVDVSIIVPAVTSDRIQEMHIKLIHISIEILERKLFPENY